MEHPAIVNNPPDPQFDSYAHSYNDLHKESVKASGEEPEYFAAYKIAYLVRTLGARTLEQELRILDFGCGIGGSIPHLLRAFPEAKILGTDVSSESVDIARLSNPTAAFDIISGDILPYRDASIDVAMAACVYHHISPNARLAWTKELHRVLKPGGHAFIFEHNPLNPLTQRVVRDCPFDDDAILLPRSESISLLENSGFDDVDVNYLVFFPKILAFMRPLERFLTKLPAGAQYVAHGTA